MEAPLDLKTTIQSVFTSTRNIEEQNQRGIEYDTFIENELKSIRQQSEALRTQYEKTIILPNGVNLLKEVAISQLAELPEEEKIPDKSPIVIQYNENQRTIEGNNVVLSGRHTDIGESGFVFPEKTVENNTSRLNCIIFISSTKIYVLDPGSFKGIKTRRRQSDRPLQDSFPNNRKLLIFDRNEFAVLDLAGEMIVLNPDPEKTCVVCWDSPRAMVFPCGHFLTCRNCSLAVVQCPTCRKTFDPRNVKMDVYNKTFNGSHQ